MQQLALEFRCGQQCMAEGWSLEVLGQMWIVTEPKPWDTL